jgi:hypothetical protein
MDFNKYINFLLSLNQFFTYSHSQTGRLGVMPDRKMEPHSFGGTTESYSRAVMAVTITPGSFLSQGQLKLHDPGSDTLISEASNVP